MKPSSLKTSLYLAAGILAGCMQTPREDPVRSATPAIINGQSCSSTTHPGALAIILSASAQSPYGPMPIVKQGCTGTLIAPDVVLTAAHCTHGDKMFAAQGIQLSNLKYYVSFQADLTYIEQQSSSPYPSPTPPKLPADVVEITKGIAHPEFDVSTLTSGAVPPTGLGNHKDVGLFFLSKGVTTVKAAVVVTSSEASQLAAQKKVQIIGYGQTTPQQSNPYQPGATGRGMRTCATSFVNKLGTHEMQIGGDASTSRKCHGDSGGPSFLTVTTPSDRKLRVVGITSRGYDAQADCYLGGVDTRVDVHLSWIDQTMKQGCADGDRAWCAVQGVIPPSYYDQSTPPDGTTPATTDGSPLIAPIPRPGVEAGAGDGGDSELTDDDGGGCACRVEASTRVSPLLLLLLGLGLVLLRRWRL